MLSLASELILVALDESGSVRKNNQAFEVSVAGAWIADLLDRGRLHLEPQAGWRPTEHLPDSAPLQEPRAFASESTADLSRQIGLEAPSTRAGGLTNRARVAGSALSKAVQAGADALAESLALDAGPNPEHEQLQVVDTTPTGVSDLDFVLVWLSGQRRLLWDWLDVLSDRPSERVLKTLLETGVLRDATKRVFGFPLLSS